MTVRRALLNGAATVALLYALTPLIFVTWLAFFRQEIPSFPPEGYSLRWFEAIFEEPKFVNGFALSFPSLSTPASAQLVGICQVEVGSVHWR